MRKIVYPGSFDPITTGHLDLIKRAADLYDEVIILIMHNLNKNGTFTPEERKLLIQEATKDIKNVSVDISSDVLMNYMDQNDLNEVLRGLRNTLDFEYEKDLFNVNKYINPKVETLFLLTDPKYVSASSSNVREMLFYNLDLDEYVPENIINLLKKIYKEKNRGI